MSDGEESLVPSLDSGCEEALPALGGIQAQATDTHAEKQARRRVKQQQKAVREHTQVEQSILKERLKETRLQHKLLQEQEKLLLAQQRADAAAHQKKQTEIPIANDSTEMKNKVIKLEFV